MTLSRSMAFKTAGLTLSLMLLGAASLWGLCGMRETLRIAKDEYQELRLVREVSIHVAAARDLLQPRDGNRPNALNALDQAIEDINRFAAFQSLEQCADGVHQQRERNVAAQSRADLADIRQAVGSGSALRLESASRDQLARMDNVLGALSTLAAQMDQVIASTQADSAARLRKSVILIGLLSAGVVLLVTLINISQYRSVMGPLRQLRAGVRRIAGGRFREQIQLDGVAEFSGLATDFNCMARELDSLYTDLEQKALARSREMVRSERLASVGFLAAGVAHEINNPLNIITGYAELSLRQADRLPESQAAADIKQALQIIREEGFRCKTITEKLVALARASGKSREAVSIARVTQDVVAMVEGLKQFGNRRVRMALGSDNQLTVWGDENELKQVVLSLVVNALQAVPPGAGQVHIQGVRQNDRTELSVTDNGCGMTPEVLEHVFEPFFSERRPDGERGIGMGLSITHAIVEAHGGRITAESNGPGQGSKFTIRLPAFDGLQAPDEQAA